MTGVQWAILIVGGVLVATAGFAIGYSGYRGSVHGRFWVGLMVAVMAVLCVITTWPR
jgi:hypothetical protein